MKIYLDSDFRCHLQPGENRTEIETSMLDGYAPAVIEGYRFIPAGQNWTREDGETFAGETAAPWMDARELDTIQRTYERQRYAEAIAAVDALLLEIGGVQ